MTFEMFINMIWENPKIIYRDIHTTPQIDFLLFNEYDKYIPLENLSENIKDLELQSKIKFFDTRKYALNTTFDFKLISDKYYGDQKVRNLRELKSENILPNHAMMYNAETAYKCLSIYLSDVFLYINKTDSYKNLEKYLNLSNQYIQNFI